MDENIILRELQLLREYVQNSHIQLSVQTARHQGFLENINAAVMQKETTLLPILTKQIRILEHLCQEVSKLSDASDRLKREVAEATDAINTLTASHKRLAKKIRDLIAASPNNGLSDEDATSLGDALDAEEATIAESISSASDVDPGEEPANPNPNS